jgi:hypothetical protein
VIAIFYFLDVFIGMFMIQAAYGSGSTFNVSERQAQILKQPSDIIEVVLLALMVLECLVKLSLTSLKKVSTLILVSESYRD